MTQRELADKVGIDVTYLSKIESGKVEPPSRKVIEDLARSLNVDSDELLLIGSKVPADLSDVIMEEPQALTFLRSVKKANLTEEQWNQLKNMVEKMSSNNKGNEK